VILRLAPAVWQTAAEPPPVPPPKRPPIQAEIDRRSAGILPKTTSASGGNGTKPSGRSPSGSKEMIALDTNVIVRLLTQMTRRNSPQSDALSTPILRRFLVPTSC